MHPTPRREPQPVQRRMLVKALVLSGLVLSSLVWRGGVVLADVFVPVPSRPVVSIVSAPGASSASAILPKFPDSGGSAGSGGVFTVEAVVSTNATLAQLESVTMCWYRAPRVGTPPTYVGGGDEECGVLNPQESFAIRWSESVAAAAATPRNGSVGFAKVTAAPFVSTAYSNVGSRTETTSGSGSYDPSATAMTIKFSFRVSSAMRADDDWRVKVVAVNDAAMCAGEVCPGITLGDRTGSAELTGRHVAFWGEMTTPWEQLGFGVVEEDTTSDPMDATAFAFVANAAADYALTGSNFVSEGTNFDDSLSLVAGVPTGAQVRFECLAADHTPAAVFTAVTTSGVRLGAEIAPTGETVNDTETISCQLSYGARAAFPLRVYSSIVTLALGQR